jgi:adenylyl-sulfate kinase
MLEGGTIWFSGLHGSGKSTIARGLAERLRGRGVKVVVLDGDELRKGVSSDLGYSLEDRERHIARVANICEIISRNGVLNIACVASPTQKMRDYAKSMIPNFLEVYVKCPLAVCEKRDVKGHYKKARGGEAGFESFLGVSLGFEEPKSPDIVLETDRESEEESISRLLSKLEQEKWIG